MQTTNEPWKKTETKDFPTQQLEVARRVAWRCNVQLGGAPKIYELDSGLNLEYANRVYIYIEEDLLYLCIVKQISDPAKEPTGHSQLLKYEHFDFGIGEGSIRHKEDPGANWTLCQTLDEAIECLLETHMRLLSEDECEIMYYRGLSLLLDNHLCDAYREAFITMLDMKCEQTPSPWFFTSETAVVSLAERDAKTPWQKYWCWLAAFNFALGAETAKCRLTLSPSHPGAQTMCLARYATEVCINLIEYASSLEGELSSSDEDGKVCSSFESAEIQNLARTIFDLLLSRLDSKDKFWFLELLWHMNGCFNLDFDLKEAVDKVAFDPDAPSYVHHIAHAKLRLLTDYPPPDDHFYSHLSYCRFEHVTPVLLQALFDKLRLEPVTDLTLAILRFYNFTTSIRGIILVAYFNSHPTLLDYDKYIQNLISNIDPQILEALNLTPKKLHKLKGTISTIIERHSDK